VTQALRAAHLDADDAAALRPAIDARAGVSALAFARRKRIGPYAAVPPDRPAREKALAALLRAGHPLDLARRIVALAPGEEPDDDWADPDQR
jgi:regulatory protein